MKTRKRVSTNLFEMRANASFSTRKPSTVTMEIDKRFSLEAYDYYLDQQENVERETGLVGFELIAVYEDGKEDSPIEIKREVPEDETQRESTSDESAEEAGVNEEEEAGELEEVEKIQLDLEGDTEDGE